MGRIRIGESEKDTKVMIDSQKLNAFARPYIEKYMRVVTDHLSEFAEAKEKLKNMIRAQI